MFSSLLYTLPHSEIKVLGIVGIGDNIAYVLIQSYAELLLKMKTLYFCAILCIS
jgi:hypothetical protein